MLQLTKMTKVPKIKNHFKHVNLTRIIHYYKGDLWEKLKRE